MGREAKDIGCELTELDRLHSSKGGQMHRGVMQTKVRLMHLPVLQGDRAMKQFNNTPF